MKPISIVPNSQGRILVVDDEPKNREILHDLLELNGYAVIEAENGIEALKKVSLENCDVILLDVKMPQMDGLEACRQLKTNPATAHIPIFMVTALTERDQRDLGIEAGANDYLTKPIERRDVLLRVRNAVYSKRLYDKVQQDLAKLRELEILRDNLTHMIVHDMRSPLMAVSWSYDLILKTNIGLSPKQQEFITMGQKCYHELIEMVNSLLDISRMEAGKMPLNRTSNDLLEIARKATESMAMLAQKKNLTLLVSGRSAKVLMDPDIIHRVFVNLLGNAIKFSPENSTSRINIAISGAMARATVMDQGPGIPPDYHTLIFEKFGQVGSRLNEEQHSSGLGLTFCKLAVEAHGGLIGVESSLTSPQSSATDSITGNLKDEFGQGSTFWFTIPMEK